MWTRITGPNVENTYSVRKTKKGDGLWRKARKVVKQREEDFRTL